MEVEKNCLAKEKKLSLTTPINELENRILKEDNPEELKNIINLFNLNIKKKDILRASKLNDLQDKTLDQISERIEKTPDLFSNKDLLDYYKVIQETLNKSDTNVDNLPNIQINQNIVNMTPTIDRESKERVIQAVKEILAKSAENNVIDVNGGDK